jgi:GNAT superfamily N-acetyltransferase
MQACRSAHERAGWMHERAGCMSGSDTGVLARPCRAADLPRLDDVLPLGDAHRRRLDGQLEGRWLYLVALLPHAAERRPIGYCLVHWRGPTMENVRAALPDCVEINHLQVAEPARGRGAGHALINAAERAAAVRRRTTIGLGVGDDNPLARRLYERLGYAPSGIRYVVEYDYLDPAGNTAHAREVGDYLVKSLPRN